MKHGLIGLLLLTGCGDDDCCGSSRDAGMDAVVPQDANTSLTEVALVPSTIDRDIDLLFVIDDSNGMLDKQRRLQTRFSSFLDVLKDPPVAGGSLSYVLPNIHLGVITTDMGTQSTGGDLAPAVATCMGTGRDGVLQKGSATLSERYLIDVANAEGTRTLNYSGLLAEAFTQMTTVGTNGCGFQQPLAAIDRALENPLNAGFVREDARLVIVLLSDGEDCSSASPVLFTTNTAALGPLSTFRCSRFGVTCDVGGETPEMMNTPGRKEGCHSSEASGVLAGVSKYATRLDKLKPTARDVLFIGITGPDTPFNVELNRNTSFGASLASSCTYDGVDFGESAFPAARIASFAHRLTNSTLANICEGFDGVLRQLGHRVRGLMGTGSCLLRPIAMPATCEAVDVDTSGMETVVPACNGTGARPCIRIVEDSEACPLLQGLKVDIARSSPAPAGIWTSVRCAL